MIGKVVILTPYLVDSPEFDNLLSVLDDINRDNNNEYLITVCDECDTCGAINDTVDKVATLEKKVCDACFVKCFETG